MTDLSDEESSPLPPSGVTTRRWTRRDLPVLHHQSSKTFSVFLLVFEYVFPYKFVHFTYMFPWNRNKGVDLSSLLSVMYHRPNFSPLVRTRPQRVCSRTRSSGRVPDYKWGYWNEFPFSNIVLLLFFCPQGFQKCVIELDSPILISPFEVKCL